MDYERQHQQVVLHQFANNQKGVRFISDPFLVIYVLFKTF